MSHILADIQRAAERVSPVKNRRVAICLAYTNTDQIRRLYGSSGTAADASARIPPVRERETFGGELAAELEAKHAEYLLAQHEAQRDLRR